MGDKRTWRERLEPFRRERRFEDEKRAAESRPAVVKLSCDVVDRRWRDVEREERRLASLHKFVRDVSVTINPAELTSEKVEETVAFKGSPLVNAGWYYI
jgi:hypothetical protein